MNKKFCRRCNEFKSFDEFYNNSNAPDGKHSLCKKCKNESGKIYKEKNFNKISVYQFNYQNKYRQTDKRKESLKKWKQSPNGKASYKKQRQIHRMKVNARARIDYDIKAGKLIHPNFTNCHYCNERANEYHHHFGYEKEHIKNVIPVCIRCHNFIHEIYEI